MVSDDDGGDEKLKVHTKGEGGKDVFLRVFPDAGQVNLGIDPDLCENFGITDARELEDLLIDDQLTLFKPSARRDSLYLRSLDRAVTGLSHVKYSNT